MTKQSALKTTIDTNLFLMSFSNLSENPEIYEHGGGLRGVIDPNLVESRSNAFSGQADPNQELPELIRSGLICAGMGKLDPKSVAITYVICCDLDKVTTDDFIREWVKKISERQHPGDCLLFIGFQNREPELSIVEAFSNKWKGTFLETHFYNRKDYKLSDDEINEQILKELFLKKRKDANYEDSEIIFKGLLPAGIEKVIQNACNYNSNALESDAHNKAYGFDTLRAFLPNFLGFTDHRLSLEDAPVQDSTNQSLPMLQVDVSNNHPLTKQDLERQCKQYLQYRWLSSYLIQQNCGWLVWFLSPLRYEKVSKTNDFLQKLSIENTEDLASDFKQFTQPFNSQARITFWKSKDNRGQFEACFNLRTGQEFTLKV